ncbi:hypothetical protein M426DRAFT_324593 [Hypoxylon sp. CI-4A]|nr:hypothetical protein M426DRAFT_324593 [Hypoxylon sp. CI-4A]
MLLEPFETHIRVDTNASLCLSVCFLQSILPHLQRCHVRLVSASSYSSVPNEEKESQTQHVKDRPFTRRRARPCPSGEMARTWRYDGRGTGERGKQQQQQQQPRSTTMTTTTTTLALALALSRVRSHTHVSTTHVA